MNCQYLTQNRHCQKLGATVSPGCCVRCQSGANFAAVFPKIDPDKVKTQKMRGLGDVVAAVTGAVGIKPCAGCKQRQETLNRLIPL